MRSSQLELPPSSSIQIAPRASGNDRPGLEACLKALRAGDTLVIWKLDRLGRNLKHLVDVVQGLNGRGVGLKVLAGQGASIDTTTANGRLMFNFFAALAEFERELIVERTVAGLAAARARGRSGGRPFKMTAAKLRLAQAAMGKPETSIADLCAELGVTRRRSTGTSRRRASSGRMGRRCSPGNQSNP